MEVYRNRFFAKLSPRSNQQAHARTCPADTEWYAVICVHHLGAGGALQAFQCGSGFFRRSFEVLVQMVPSKQVVFAFL